MTITPCYRFGPFRLDVATRTLWRGDDTIAVAGRSFDCIRLLIEQRHRAVGRDELIQALWGHPDVSDGVLGQTILTARRALDDTGKDQQYIRTVPRFGYHWHAPVTMTTGQPAVAGLSNDALDATDASVAIDLPAPVQGPMAVPTPRSKKTSRTTRLTTLPILVGALVALVLLVGALMLHRSDPESASATPASEADTSGQRLLVRPLRVSGDERMGWFRLGGMALIGDQLREHGLPVVASGTVAALADHLGDDASVDAWLQPVDAHGLIDGQAVAQGNRWRLDLQVTGLDGSRQPRIREEGEDLLAVARRASQRLAMTLGGTTTASPVDSGDHDAVLREIESALLSGHTAQAARLLDAADENLTTLPRLQLAQAHMAWLNGDHDAASAIWRRLIGQLEPDTDSVLLAEAWNGLGVWHYARGEHDQSIEQLDRAIGLMDARHPTLGQALSNRALARSALADDAAARRDFADARAVLEAGGDTLTLVTVDLGSAMHALAQDRLTEALPVLDRVADDYAAFGHRLNELNARMHAARTRWLLLDPAGAQATMTRMAELEAQLSQSGWHRYSTLVRAQILIDTGLHDQAGQLLADLAAGTGSDPALGWQVAAQQAVLAHQTGAFDAARRHADQALSGTAQGTMQRRLMAQLHLLRVRLALASDDGDGDHLLAAFARWTGDDSGPVGALYLAIAQAERARSRAQPESARQHYEQAMQGANAGRIPRDLLMAASAYADFLLDAGQLPAAQLVAERVSGWANQHYDAALIQLRLYHDLGRVDAWRALLPRVQALARERTIPERLLVAPVPDGNFSGQSGL